MNVFVFVFLFIKPNLKNIPLKVKLGTEAQ